jgi:hypothetical protein
VAEKHQLGRIFVMAFGFQFGFDLRHVCLPFRIELGAATVLFFALAA